MQALSQNTQHTCFNHHYKACIQPHYGYKSSYKVIKRDTDSCQSSSILAPSLYQCGLMYKHLTHRIHISTASAIKPHLRDGDETSNTTTGTGAWKRIWGWLSSKAHSLFLPHSPPKYSLIISAAPQMCTSLSLRCLSILWLCSEWDVGMKI